MSHTTIHTMIPVRLSFHLEAKSPARQQIYHYPLHSYAFSITEYHMYVYGVIHFVQNYINSYGASRDN